jgi:SNF2 family DNA or RNA helicase
MVITKKGLILLSKEQKDLIRFMQKYTKYEATNESVEVDGSKTFKKFILPFNRARVFELFELRKLGIDGALLPAEIELCERLANLTEVPSYELPENLTTILRPYQKVGFNWLRFLYEHKLGACLADDMGLGKTLQTIAFLKSIYHTLNKVLIVCPVTILLNWEKEIQRFSDMELAIYHGGARAYPADKKIILTSYGVMKKESEAVFANTHFDILILDEVQHLKNIRSLGAFSARKINAEFRICLTGTPVENDLSEFYNILDLSIPGIWGDLQFVRAISNTKTRLIARKTAAPFILRRTNAQVLHDLPPKIENNVYL